MSEIINLRDHRPPKMIPVEYADQIVVGQLFANLAHLNLIALYLAETGRAPEGGCIEAFTVELHAIAARLKDQLNV